MTILHITDIAQISGNGVAVAVTEYLKHEMKETNVAAYNLDDNIVAEGIKTYNSKNYNQITLLPEPFNKPDLVIFNEVYKPKYIKLYKECLKNNIKYVIIPHGCLVQASQNKRKLKKLLGNTLLFNKFIKNASAIQFLNNTEKENTKLKYKKAIIAGNGVNKPSYKNDSNCKNKDLVFIGRYEIKHKGLDLLVNVCNKYRNWFKEKNIKIQLYGRDSGNNLSILKELIEKNNVSDILKLNGPVYEEEKKNVLENAYAFIQTSRFEGQPMGIIEALSIGLPCIVTYGTYVGDFIEKNNCGIASDFNIDLIFNSIKTICENEKLRNTMAKNAYKKTIKEFNWETVINKTIKKYREILK